VQVPRAERREFREVLEAVGYPFWDETRNRAYQLYLGQARPAS
jgi:threonine dehydratase